MLTSKKKKIRIHLESTPEADKTGFDILLRDYLDGTLENNLEDMGITKMGEGAKHELSDCNLLYLYRHLFKWTTLYEEPYWDALNPYAVKLYEFLGKIYSIFA